MPTVPPLSPYEYRRLRHRVREVLRARGLKERDLVERMGVSQPYVNDLLHGRRPVTPAFARAACDLTGLAFEALFFFPDYSPLRKPDSDLNPAAELSKAV